MILKTDIKKHTFTPNKDLPTTTSNSTCGPNKYTFGILLGLVGIIILIVFKNFIFHKYIYLFKDIGSDSYNVYFPNFFHFASYLRTEGIPMWTFSQGMGQNLYPGNINDPFDLLLYIIGPDNIAHGLISVELLKIFLAGSLFYAYLGILKSNKTVRLLGGLLMAFSGYIILGSTGWYSHSTNVVYTLFLLFSFEKCYQQNKCYFLPIAVFLIATNPFRLYINGVFLVFYTIFRLANDEGINFKKFILTFTKIGLLSILGMSLSAVFITGSLLGMINSPRVIGEVSKVNELSTIPLFSFAGTHHNVTAILRLFSNDMLGNGSNFKGWGNYLEAPSFYCGLFTLIILPQLFVFLKPRKKIIFAIFLGLLIFPVIFPWFRYAMFLFMGDYYKHGLSLFIPITLIIFGMFALDQIIKNHKIYLGVLVGTLVALLVFLYFPYFSFFGYSEKFISLHPLDKNLQESAGYFLLFYAILLIAYNYLNNKKALILLIVLLACFETGYMTNKAVNSRIAISSEEFEQKKGYNDFTLEAVDYIKSKDRSFYRINKDYLSNITKHSSYNDAKVQGYYGLSSYSSFNQLNYIRFLREIGEISSNNELETRWVPGLMNRPLLNSFASVKYSLSKNQKPPALTIGYDMMGSVGDVKLLENKNYLPLGYVYDKFVTLKDFHTLSKIQKDLLLYQAAVVDSPSKQIKNTLQSFDLKNITTYPINSFTQLEQAISQSANKINKLSGFSSKLTTSPEESQKKAAQREKLLMEYSRLAKIRKQVLAEQNDAIKERQKTVFKINSFSENNIDGVVNMTKPGALFFSIPFDKGWHIFVNGCKIQPERINIGFTGLFLDKGVYNIELKFSVPYLNVGLMTSFIALILYLGFFFFILTRQRKRVHSDNGR